MGKSLTRIGLTALGVLCLLGGLGAGQSERQVETAVPGVPVDTDSLARIWPQGYIPLWALTQTGETVGLGISSETVASGTADDCPQSLTLDMPSRNTALRFDSERNVTELYNRDVTGFITRYDISSDLTYATAVIPINPGGPKLVADFDHDGRLELVTQYFDKLNIHSLPDGALLATFQWPGKAIVMYPLAIDVDDDPHLEIYVTPLNESFSARIVLIDYNSGSATFEKVVDIPAPFGAAGLSAAGDFDEDGRVEFISGTFDFGYRLYEWQEGTIAYIGLVGDSLNDMNYNAIACRPKPGGVLHALLGHSDWEHGYHYQLLEPTGNNTFHVAHVFQEITGFTGVHPCWAADTDCDGLDELAMGFHPNYRTWEWDTDSAAFVQGCEWSNTTYGTLSIWRDIDLNQDGRREWATVNHLYKFRAFPDAACVDCDPDSLCPAGLVCYCSCEGDPVCDSVTNVLDVVAAVDVAFRDGVVDPDPYVQCPLARTDVDCNGYTNVLDVVHLVNVTFRGGDPAAEFCAPCGP